MKLHTAVYRLFTRVLTLLILVGTAWLAWGNAGGGWAQAQNQPPTTARFVPRQAPLVVSLMDPNDASGALLESSAPSLQSGKGTQLNQLPARLLAGAGLNYRTDIQPWVTDEVTFALTSFDLDDRRENGLQPGYLMVFTTRGQRSSQTCLEALWQKQTAAEHSLLFEQYKGINFISTDLTATIDPIEVVALPGAVTPPQAFTAAMVDRRYVLVANSSQVLRQAIAGLKDRELQLATAPAYQQALDHLQQPQRNGVAFVNLAAWAAHTQPEATAAPLRYRSLMLNVGQRRQDLLVETVLVAAPDQAITAVSATSKQPVPALSYVPAESPLVVAGLNLAQLWTQIREDTEGYPSLSQWIDATVAQWGTHWHVDLPEDVFPWVTGDYAVAMVPHPAPMAGTSSGMPGTAHPDWLAVYGQDPDHPIQPFRQHLLDQAAAQGLGTSPYQWDPQHQISAWIQLRPAPNADPPPPRRQRLQADVMGASTQIDDHELMMTSFGVLKSVLAAPQAGLAQQASFRRAIAALAEPNQGYLYLDWSVMRPILEQQLPGLRQWEQSAAALFSALETVTVTSYGETPEVQRAQLLFSTAAAPED